MIIRQCANQQFLTNLVIGDKAAFALNGKVNTWKVKEYALVGNPPQFNYDVRSSCQKITVWGGYLVMSLF